ncbi:MAG: hypothetical protein IT379_10390 [Deltaproteobacteria bacterium]|nr:hypothetical protein [Deltaproteobacteria bacterium]
MARSWLEAMMPEILASLPPPVFAPAIVHSFGEVRTVIAMIESSVEQKQVEVEAEQRETLARAAADPNHSWLKSRTFSSVMATEWDVRFTFPLILRRSLMIAISSHTEHALERWCAWLHGNWSLQTTPKAFKKAKGSTMHAYLLYLRDEAQLALGDFEAWPEWQAVDAYRLVRNCLAHDGGVIDSAGDRAKIAALPDVEVDDSGLFSEDPIIQLGAKACEHAVEAADTLLTRIAGVAAKDSRAPTANP